MSDEGAFATPETTPEPRTCAWCATPASHDATTCGSCGAALAQRESLGDVRIAGLTAVDPALEDYDKRPMHLRGPSASHGVAPALIVGATAGGPIGAVLIGGVVAVAAAEYLGAKQPGTGGAARDDVGKPSEVALQALEHAEATAGDAPAAKPDPEAAEADAAAADGGMSIWRDLPPPDADGG
jgi:hypothetical protein